MPSTELHEHRHLGTGDGKCLSTRPGEGLGDGYAYGGGDDDWSGFSYGHGAAPGSVMFHLNHEMWGYHNQFRRETHEGKGYGSRIGRSKFGEPNNG